MKCPHCFVAVPEGRTACPHCGFSAAAVRTYLGCEWVRLERITDQSVRLSLKDTRHLETLLDDFERSFPQCFLAVYLGPLPPELTVSDLGFWLINHGAFNTHIAAKRNDFGMVLVIDPVQQSAGLTVGYALEALLSEAVLANVLGRLQRPLRRMDFAKGIQVCAKHLKKALRRQARPEPAELHQPPTPSSDLAEMGLQTLRQDHTFHQNHNPRLPVEAGSTP